MRALGLASLPYNNDSNQPRYPAGYCDKKCRVAVDGHGSYIMIKRCLFLSIMISTTDISSKYKEDLNLTHSI